MTFFEKTNNWRFLDFVQVLEAWHGRREQVLDVAVDVNVTVDEVTEVSVNSSEVLYLIFTSGSTGHPKAACRRVPGNYFGDIEVEES